MSDYQSKKLARRYLRNRTRREKVAGEVRFVKDRATGEVERDIPDTYEYDSESQEIEDLSEVLLALSKASGYLVPAHNKFTKINGSSISPDGKLGGKGYVQEISEMREGLTKSIETISSIVDTLDDELKAPHWDKKLPEDIQSEVEDNVDESEDIIGDPESFTEEDYIENLEDEEEKRSQRQPRNLSSIED